jgi:hypothetical protein
MKIICKVQLIVSVIVFPQHPVSPHHYFKLKKLLVFFALKHHLYPSQGETKHKKSLKGVEKESHGQHNQNPSEMEPSGGVGRTQLAFFPSQSVCIVAMLLCKAKSSTHD